MGVGVTTPRHKARSPAWISATLVMQPTSQTELALTDAALAQLALHMIQLEQAMLAAQQ
jgi:hypothetical protein